MRELRDRFHDADMIEPPDVFSDALRREPSTPGIGEQSRKGRAAVIVVSLMIAVLAIGFAARAFGGSNNPATVPGEPASVVVPADPCALITSADVEAATDSTVTASGPVPKSQMIIPSNYVPTCDYRTNGRFGTIITVTDVAGADARLDELASDPNAEPVSGFDDQAFVSGKGSIWVKVGDGYFSIGAQYGGSDEAVAVLTALAHDAVQSLQTPSPVDTPPTASVDPTAQASDEPQSDPGVDLVCHEDGTVTARTEEFATTAAGVPVTAWSPDRGRMLWVELPGWMPFDNQMWGLDQGKDTFMLMAPPGQIRIGCVDAAHHGNTLDPSTSVVVRIVDAGGFFLPARTDCGSKAIDRSVFNLFSRISQDELASGFPKPMSLEDTIRTYLPGVVDSDAISPAMYTADPRLESVLVTRDGSPLALVSRTKIEGEDMPTFLRVETCPGSGVG